MANKRKASDGFTPRKSTRLLATPTASASSTPQKGKARVSIPTRAPRGSSSPTQAGQDDIEFDDADEEPEPIASSSALASLPIETLRSHLTPARARVLSVLGGALPPPDDAGEECIGLAKQWTELQSTLWSTTSNGEGNSTLIVGARGVGKTLLLNSVLRSISSGPAFHHVRLNASLQTTDAAAMRVLASQLVKLGAITLPEDETAALTADPVEAEEAEVENVDGEEEEEEDPVLVAERKEALEGAVLSSIATTTSTILTLLSTGGTSSKPLLISIDNLDLLTSRPRQALLYVLLDAVQAGSYTPGLAVIGLTSRLDTTDLFEKRVRSRFSGRTLNLYASNLERWEEIARRALEMGAEVEGDDEDSLAFAEAWKSDVNQLFEDERFQQLLQDQHDLSADVGTLYRILTIPILNLSPTSPTPTSSLFLQSATSQRSSSLDTILSDLTPSEFAMLVAAKHLQTRDRAVFNFEMCYFELKRWVERTQRELEGAGTGGIGLNVGASSKGVNEGSALGDRRKAMAAFISLLDLELFLPEAMLATLAHFPGPQAGAASLAKTARGSVRSEYLRVRCAVDAAVVVRAAKSRNRRAALGTALVQWALGAGA